MTVTSGFFNAISSDRQYSALQMGQLFDGLIFDGVYESEGDAFAVTEDSPVSMNVDVGSGRAWFNSTWTYNDAAIALTVATADALLPRIDYIYLEVNKDSATRANKIDIMTGTPASTPVPPTLTQAGNVYQYPLAEIYVGAGVTTILQANITMVTGTEDCPFVTGPISGNIIDHDHTSGNGGQVDTSGIANAAITSPKLDSSVAGDGLVGAAGTPLSVNVDSDHLEIASDAVRIKDGGIGIVELADHSKVQLFSLVPGTNAVVKETGIALPDSVDSFIWANSIITTFADGNVDHYFYFKAFPETDPDGYVEWDLRLAYSPTGGNVWDHITLTSTPRVLHQTLKNQAVIGGVTHGMNASISYFSHSSGAINWKIERKGTDAGDTLVGNIIVTIAYYSYTTKLT